MTKNAKRRIIQVIATQFILFLILFISAGTIKWIWPWLFLMLSIILGVINFFIIPSDVVEERGRKKENVKKWDKILTSLNILPTILLYTCCGLDYRFNWTGSLPVVINISGFILTFTGSMLFSWSMVSNKFFSTLVRIQNDRQHKVAESGPYKFIRHPGYIGYILMSVGTPMAIGTLWGLIFSCITTFLLIIRTSLEDSTLKQELPGYAEYTVKVKYRLLPYIW